MFKELINIVNNLNLLFKIKLIHSDFENGLISSIKEIFGTKV